VADGRSGLGGFPSFGVIARSLERHLCSQRVGKSTLFKVQRALAPVLGFSDVGPGK
jgi:hypothetical protein